MVERENGSPWDCATYWNAAPSQKYSNMLLIKIVGAPTRKDTSAQNHLLSGRKIPV